MQNKTRELNKKREAGQFFLEKNQIVELTVKKLLDLILEYFVHICKKNFWQNNEYKCARYITR